MNDEFKKRVFSSLIIIPTALFFIIMGSYLFIFFLSIFFLLAINEWLKLNKKNIFLKIFGICFLLTSLYSAFLFREHLGLTNFLLIIIVCTFTDLGGYFFGKSFKGPKLSKLSPNKTYAGVIGSFIFSIIIAFAYKKYFGFIEIKLLLQIKELDNNTNLIFLLFVLLVSLISQIGDLVISYFKRKAKVKDTGKILPGHGGLLDRVDGLIFAVPFSYIILTL